MSPPAPIRTVNPNQPDGDESPPTNRRFTHVLKSGC
jgi:hypothetical protein